MLFSIIFFTLIFVVTYLVYSFLFNDKLKKEQYTKISELTFLVRKFNLDKKKMSYKRCLNGVSIINAFIIAFTITVVDALNIDIVFVLIVAFIMMVILILICYFAYGKYLNKKWGIK